MELEVRSLDTATRRELSKKVDQYKKSLASLADDHKKIKEKEEREGLFGDRDDLAVRCLFVLSVHLDQGSARG
jgi:vesicle transport through interaction with t-SNAREs 1